MTNSSVNVVPARGTSSRGIRAARNLSAAVVAGIAAWSSYQHMVHVALSVGEHPDVAYVLPLSVDGMLVVASIAMVDDRRSGRTVRWSARLAFGIGVLASLASNVAAAQPHLGARIVAAWPALALLLTVELLSRSGKAVRIRPLATVPEPAKELTVEEAEVAAHLAVDAYREVAGKPPLPQEDKRKLMSRGAEQTRKATEAARRVNGSPDGEPTGVLLPATRG